MLGEIFWIGVATAPPCRGKDTPTLNRWLCEMSLSAPLIYGTPLEDAAEPLESLVEGRIEPDGTTLVESDGEAENV